MQHLTIFGVLVLVALPVIQCQASEKDELALVMRQLDQVQARQDWTLSCVRGPLTSITFVFTDGTVMTLPSPDGQQQGENQEESERSEWQEHMD